MLLVGDFMLNMYVYEDAGETSPETPVPIFPTEDSYEYVQENL